MWNSWKWKRSTIRWRPRRSSPGRPNRNNSSWVNNNIRMLECLATRIPWSVIPLQRFTHRPIAINGRTPGNTDSFKSSPWLNHSWSMRQRIEQVSFCFIFFCLRSYFNRSLLRFSGDRSLRLTFNRFRS